MINNTKLIIKRTVLFLFIFLVYITVLAAFGMHCPFADVLGIECPTCGVSRALLSLLRADFNESVSYHPLAIPLLIAVWLLCNIEYLKHKKLITTIALSIVILNFDLYFMRMVMQYNVIV